MSIRKSFSKYNKAKTFKIDDEMTEDGYSYWVEASCSDGSYQQTPHLHPSAEKDTAPAPYSQQDYQLLLQFLGISEQLQNPLNQQGQSSQNEATLSTSSDLSTHLNSTNSLNSHNSNIVPAGQFVHYYIWDHLGSTRVIIRRYDSAVIESIKYLPFGQQINQYSSPKEISSFAGYTRDFESSMDYLGFRYYNSSIYRFIQPDIISKNQANTLGLNKYIYVLDNPITLIDYLGLAENELTKNQLQCREANGVYECSIAIEVKAELTPKKEGLTELEKFFYSWYLSQGSSPEEALIDAKSQAEILGYTLKKIWQGYYLGTGYGTSALEYYADVLTLPEASLFEKIPAGAGAFFSALWTPETYIDTASTLSGAYTIRIIGPFPQAKDILGRPYGKIIRPHFRIDHGRIKKKDTLHLNIGKKTNKHIPLITNKRILKKWLFKEF